MAYTDWIDIVDSTLDNKKDLSILEFGLGAGTKYLLDTFKSVYSYELIDDQDPSLIEWYNGCVDQFKNYHNWNKEVVLWKDIDFVDYNPILPQPLLIRIDQLFSKYKFDSVLIDGGYHVRGDIANYILHKHQPKYVIIHDTNYAYVVDGYSRIELPTVYTTVKYSIGEGTHIFIKK